MEVVVLIGKLPVARKCVQRLESSITAVVIHHDDSTPPARGREVRHIQDEAHYHVEHRKFRCLAYHYMIDQRGVIYKCNPVTSITSHAAGGNRYSVGIALMGRFDYYQPKPEQLIAADWLIKELKKAYPSIVSVLPHRRVRGSSTDCPGKLFTDAMVAELGK